MRQRARSPQDKEQRAEDLLTAAEAVARDLGGIRHVTLLAVTERAGLHRTGVRRYYSSKEELLLELAERGWNQWRGKVAAEVGDRTGLDAPAMAAVLSATLASLPVFCDLLTHVTLYLEGDVDIERARRYKSNAFAAHDAIAETLVHAGRMTPEQVTSLLAAAVLFAAGLWQASHPTPTLAALYEQEPHWYHDVRDFRPRLDSLLAATATGLVAPPA